MENNTAIFPKGEESNKAFFTGESYHTPLLKRDKNNDYSISNVTFEPGARTNWHTHPKGQVLIVTEGEGIYQERGMTARIIKKGDVINIPEDTEHWHGATSGNRMVHIAITNFKEDTNVVWLEPVTEDEFKRANNEINTFKDE